MRALPCLAALAVSLTAAQAWTMDEAITDIRVHNAVRTDEETVRSIAGVSIGQHMQPDTLDIVRERLHTSGLFADVNVYWEPYQDGVRINIVVKEKFPWAPLPTFSYSPGNISGGAIVAHGNLLAKGKRGVIGGRISNVDSGALAAYEDRRCGARGFFHCQGEVPTADHSRIQQRVRQPVRLAVVADAQHQAALLRRRHQRGCGLVSQGAHLGRVDF